jgi:SAM-dependent methyltransferase
MLNWKHDLNEVPIDVILLFEEFHFRYLEGTNLHKELALIFKSKPYIEWFIRNKVPELSYWVDEISQKYKNETIGSIDEQRNIELKVIHELEDWIIYVLSPDDYNNQPFNNWDKKELLEITDWRNKIVVDIGSGTGKQIFTVAPYVKIIYSVEPVTNLRKFLRNKSREIGYKNIYVIDGFITSIPFENEFADIVMCGHVLGDSLAEELDELERVTKTEGYIIACPGNIDKDNEQHKYLTERGYNWQSFLEPGNVIGSGHKRKYWKKK